MYKGDFMRGSKIPLGWTSNNSLGAALVASLGTVIVYRYDQLSSSVTTTSVGVSENTVNINGLVGYNRVVVDSSLSMGWYLPHCDYEVHGSAFSVEGNFVNLIAGSFSINNRHHPGLLSRSTLSGAASGTATLNLNESDVTDITAGGFLIVSTKSQGRGISAIAGATRLATLDRSWTSIPVAGDRYEHYVGSLPLSGSELADSFLTRNIATGADGGRNVASALAPLRNKVAVGGSTITVFTTDDSTSLWTGSVTTAGSALASVDPA